MRVFDLFERKDEPGTFVGVRFDDDTLDRLVELQKTHEVPNPLSKREFHATIICSKVTLDWDDDDELDETAKPKAWEVFNTRDGNRCLVLLLDSPYLEGRFDKAMELGGTHDFDDYKPHVTLSYDIGADFDHKELPLPDFTLAISEEYSEKLDLS